jgi:hypothetical protein
MRRLKSLFRRANPSASELNPTSEVGEDASALNEDECEDDPGLVDTSCLHPHHGRSRIGTETSVENPTCIENPGPDFFAAKKCSGRFLTT